MTANNQPGDLRMLVQSDPYEVECKDCSGSGAIQEYIGTEQPGESSCPYCHGTGKRTVTLEGNVRIDEQEYQTSVGSPIYTIFLTDTAPDVWRYQSYETMYDARSKAQASIIEAHRAGTLPIELYSDTNPDGLEEVSDDRSN